MPTSMEFLLKDSDALLIVDVQRDFLPGGTLAVPDGDAVIGPINSWIDRFTEAGLPVIATRDWHPIGHCSFREQGGPWPPHCVVGTPGARFSNSLKLPAHTMLVSKATHREADVYSGFGGTDLHQRLRKIGVRRLFVAGLATDYCVLNTVLDARRLGYETVLLGDCVRPVEAHQGDGRRAVEEMTDAGAILVEA